MNTHDSAKSDKHKDLNYAIFRSLLSQDFKIIDWYKFCHISCEKLIYSFQINEDNICIMAYRGFDLIKREFHLSDIIANYNTFRSDFLAMHFNTVANLSCLHKEYKNYDMCPLDLDLPSKLKWASCDFNRRSLDTKTGNCMSFKSIQSEINKFNALNNTSWRLPTRENYEELIHNLPFYNKGSLPFFINESAHRCVFFADNYRDRYDNSGVARYWTSSLEDNHHVVFNVVQFNLLHEKWAKSPIFMNSVSDFEDDLLVRLVTD